MDVDFTDFCCRFCSANKSEVKRVENWRCPSSGWTSPSGSRRRDGSADLKARAIGPAVGHQLQPAAAANSVSAVAKSTARPRAVPDSGVSGRDSFKSTDLEATSTLHIHVILLVLVGLFLTMIAVGILSYYRALYS